MAHNILGVLFTVVATVTILNTIFRSPPQTLHSNAKTAVKTAFFYSLVPLVAFMYQGSNEGMNTVSDWEWVNLGLTTLNITFKFDMYQIIFLPIALLVTWSILEFSTWYMEQDPKMGAFSKHLLIFLLAMIMLISAGNMVVLFLGWEGVGFMSFLLIGWYHARSDAATAALQAVMYNRIGDIGFLLAFCWLLKNSVSTNLDYIFSTSSSTFLLIAFITAAASKSAQFMLHPWLVSAMEGPTPVSALLHSSTMIVAGVFLLVRIHPLLAQNQLALTICLCLGAISSAFAAMSALTQNDIKKIIAFSTSSQLGLMMVSIGVNLPNLAFFHICTHAFFKAMLFLCSGIIIHNLNNNQDIRFMGGLHKALPITTICVVVGSLALVGTPFLIGFYSKDAIIEATITSSANTTAILLTLIATAFTAVYSLRLIYYTAMSQPRSSQVTSFDESLPAVKGPITRLAIGSIISGPLLFYLLFPALPTTHTMPTFIKLTALIITLLSFLIAYDLAQLSWFTPPKDHALSKTFEPSAYSRVFHRVVVTTTLDSAWQIVSHVIENTWMKFLGADVFPSAQLHPTKLINMTHKAMIQLYMALFFISLVLVLLTLLLVSYWS
ncbi:NADH dehydrogenase subunit 5 (mitochondrion) [Nanorana parkeri]|uniref:NADH-ubiquinone oxidoreductase chain 5 n=1 Tax=Nanorana parkeri TaxID=125878 RepID=A0A0U1ZEF0_9NEOB|nr:NADH dehydrogenase subunit 5 [Nanorana parkeri]AJW59697.1 NADH dehydrogenase subunit 5 [Nanorana parkeri]